MIHYPANEYFLEHLGCSIKQAYRSILFNILACMYVCVYVCVCVCVRARACVYYVYVRMYVCRYVCNVPSYKKYWPEDGLIYRYM